jgi:hypothetical protein
MSAHFLLMWPPARQGIGIGFSARAYDRAAARVADLAANVDRPPGRLLRDLSDNLISPHHCPPGCQPPIVPPGSLPGRAPFRRQAVLTKRRTSLSNRNWNSVAIRRLGAWLGPKKVGLSPTPRLTRAAPSAIPLAATLTWATRNLAQLMNLPAPRRFMAIGILTVVGR